MSSVRTRADPGTYRGGIGVEKGGTVMKAERTVMSYCCDRERGVTWGLLGWAAVHPSRRLGESRARSRARALPRLDLLECPESARATCSRGLRQVAAASVTRLTGIRRSVCEDVTDGYVSIERALEGLRGRRTRDRRRPGRLGRRRLRRQTTRETRIRDERTELALWGTRKQSQHGTGPARSTCSTSSANTSVHPQLELRRTPPKDPRWLWRDV